MCKTGVRVGQPRFWSPNDVTSDAPASVRPGKGPPQRLILRSLSATGLRGARPASCQRDDSYGVQVCAYIVYVLYSVHTYIHSYMT